jgi:hypothetical protein
MSVKMFTARVKKDKIGDVEAAAEKMFAAIKQKQPQGVRYASCRLSDGETFVAILELEGEENPLFTIAEFVQFQESLKDWVAQPPTPEVLQVIGSYRLFELDRN